MWGNKMRNNKDAAILNSLTSIFAQIISLAFSFVIRKYLVRLFNIEMLGIHGVLNEVVSFLSLFELGISTSIIYRLISPVAQNNEAQIVRLYTIIKKSYHFIGGVMVIAGIGGGVFLGTIISVETVTSSYVYRCYLVLSFGTILSFVISYYRTIFIAYQKQYFCNLVDLVIHGVFCVTKLISIIYCQSFMLYLVVHILQSICSNLCIRRFCYKRYPFLKQIFRASKQEEKVVFTDIKNVAIARLAGYVYSSTDNSIISAICGTSVVGYISNYKTVFTPLRMIINTFNSALVPIWGSFINRQTDKKEINNIFEVYVFFEYIISVLLVIPVVVLIDGFIALWIGNEYWIPFSLTLLIGLDIYINAMQEPNMTVMNAVGYFKENKVISEAATIVNLFISILLAFLYGAGGVLLGTIFALLIFWIGRSYIVHIKFFGFSLNQYIKYLVINIIYIFLYFFQLFLCYKLVNCVGWGKNIFQFILFCFLVEIFLLTFNLLLWRKSKKYLFIKNIFLNYINKWRYAK